MRSWVSPQGGQAIPIVASFYLIDTQSSIMDFPAGGTGNFLRNLLLFTYNQSAIMGFSA
ncbi:MAG: hypothetical protein AB9897_00665 [Anaerolineaceae bacterium]